jgi:[ribosomal protein S5]-alanine N-acetyltransferase
MDFVADLAGTVHGCPNCRRSLIVPREDNQPAEMLPGRFETPGLVLRRLEADDWSKLVPYLSDQDSLPHDYHAMDDHEVQQWIEEDSARRLTDSGQTIHLGIEIKNEQAFLGHFDLRFEDMHHVAASFQLILNRQVFRHPLGVEALTGLLVFAFRRLNLHRITTSVLAENLEIQRCFQAAGMRQEGVFRKDQRVNAEWKDSVLYAMLREDYDSRLAGRG